jgi:hypothetical protein
MLGKYIKHCEDSLTASAISHLLHLPSELFWRILREACMGNDLPDYCGEVRQVKYWPKWSPNGTDNSRYVEPDVFLRFDDFDLIIEAKRWDIAMQYQGQWENELAAYRSEYGDTKKLFFLALGGNANEISEDLDGVKIVKCKWIDLLHVIKDCQKELNSLKFPQHHQTAQQRVLADTVDFFYWHGIVAGRWFKDFDFERHKLQQDELFLEILRRIKGNIA